MEPASLAPELGKPLPSHLGTKASPSGFPFWTAKASSTARPIFWLKMIPLIAQVGIRLRQRGLIDPVEANPGQSDGDTGSLLVWIGLLNGCGTGYKSGPPDHTG